MSEENVEIVRKAFDAFSRGDLKGTLDHFAPESEFRPSGRFVDSQQVYRGREGWIDFWDTFRAAWESITISIERIEDLGDQVLVLGTFHGKGRGSGVEVSDEAAWLQTIQDGLILHTVTFPNWAEALEAAGLSE